MDHNQLQEGPTPGSSLCATNALGGVSLHEPTAATGGRESRARCIGRHSTRCEKAWPRRPRGRGGARPERRCGRGAGMATDSRRSRVRSVAASRRGASRTEAMGRCSPPSARDAAEARTKAGRSGEAPRSCPPRLWATAGSPSRSGRLRTMCPTGLPTGAPTLLPPQGCRSHRWEPGHQPRRPQRRLAPHRPQRRSHPAAAVALAL
mmetsp:Transcript_20253/g.58731  ORF Transcript_20253/g.58731 Transcript_20253/m.58731 type:complete len:206 (+) Transcript_20253:971-1588(+)